MKWNFHAEYIECVLDRFEMFIVYKRFHIRKTNKVLSFPCNCMYNVYVQTVLSIGFDFSLEKLMERFVWCYLLHTLKLQMIEQWKKTNNAMGCCSMEQIKSVCFIINKTKKCAHIFRHIWWCYYEYERFVIIIIIFYEKFCFPQFQLT